MWFRKDLKKRARHCVRANYLNAVAVCLIMAFFVGAYATMFSAGEESSVDAISLHGAANSDIARAMAEDITRQLTETNEEPTPMTGATRGVLASVFNNTTQSGSFIFGVLNSVNQLVFHGQILASIIVFLGAVFSFLYWLLIGNVLRVGECRFYLESRLYPGSSPNRLLFVFRVRRMKNVAKIMFLRVVYITLWCLTIVGGVVINYSYRMVPFILAENPDIEAKDAFRLSAAMMRGQKWRTFVLDMSFLLWESLSLMTMGIVGFFYVNPYQTATRAELYVALREKVLEDEHPLAAQLNDIYLHELPAGEAMRRYPAPLYSIPEFPGRRWISTDFHQRYSLTSLALLFFTYGLIGWLWETCFYLFVHGEFSNPGVLHGPWLPIYACGGVLMLVLLKRWRDRPALTFLLIMLLCAVIEYVTGWYLETFQGAMWWDYSGYLFNLHGRVCLEGLLVFGLFGCVSIYFLAPVLNGIYKRLPSGTAAIIACVLILAFSVDVVYSLHFKPNMPERIAKPVAAVMREEEAPTENLEDREVYYEAAAHI